MTRARGQTRRFFLWGVSIRNSLRSNKTSSMRARASKTRSSCWVLENDCRQWFQPSQCLASFCLLKTCYQVRFRSMYKYQVSVAGLTKIKMQCSEKDKDRSYRRAFVYISTFFFFLFAIFALPYFPFVFPNILPSVKI